MAKPSLWNGPEREVSGRQLEEKKQKSQDSRLERAAKEFDKRTLAEELKKYNNENDSFRSFAYLIK